MASSRNYFNPENFEDFLIKLKANDENVWEVLSFVLKRIVVNFTIKKGFDYNTTGKIFQDTISTFYEKFRECDFENFSKLKSYVLAIADNKIKEEYRNIFKERKLTELSNVSVDNLGFANFIEDKENFNETKNIIKRLLNSLENREREIIIGVYYNKESIKDISERLAISTENCRVIKYRAIRKFRKMLKYES